MPDLVGKSLGVIRSEALKCFNVTAAIAPDGHNVLDDPVGATGAWTITAVAPPVGAAVTGEQPITVTVAPLITSSPAPAVNPAPPPPSVPPTPPAGARAVCADGTYSFSKHRSGACSNHDGVARLLAPPG